MRTRERRRSRRHPKRTQVRFWTKDEEATPYTGHTRNLSGTGVFICTHRLYPRGTRIGMEVVESGTRVMFEGIVARRIQVDQELRKLGESGMGVRFLQPEELVKELRMSVGGRAKTRDAYSVHFQDVQQFLRTFVNDLAQGGLFVPTPSPAPLNSVVTIELFPPGCNDQPVQVSARVVRRVEPDSEEDSTHEAGMGVAFVDRDTALRSFKVHIDRLQQ